MNNHSKKFLKALLRRAGLDVRRIEPAPPARHSPLPLATDGTLGLFDTPIGRLWVPLDAERDLVVRAIRAAELFEEPIIELGRRYITLGSSVIDVGANFGQMAIYFSRLVGERGHVHAVEANPFVAAILRRNLEATRTRNVVVHEVAAWHHSGESLCFPVPDLVRFGSHGSYGIAPGRQSRDADSWSVRSLALDDIPVAGPVSFVKIDVQGSDLAAMRGARRLLATHRPAVVFEFEQQFQKEFGTDFQQYVDFVRDIGYVFRDVVLGINYLIVPAHSGRPSRPA